MTIQRLNIDTSVWMKTFIPVNAEGIKYYGDSRVTSKQQSDGKDIPIKHTLLIFQQGLPASPRRYYCELHRMVYPINGTCPGCQNEQSDDAITAGVTKA